MRAPSFVALIAALLLISTPLAFGYDIPPRQPTRPTYPRPRLPHYNAPSQSLTDAEKERRCRGKIRTVVLPQGRIHNITRVVVISDSEAAEKDRLGQNEEKTKKKNEVANTNDENAESKLCADGCCKYIYRSAYSGGGGSYHSGGSIQQTRYVTKDVRESLVPVWTLLEPSEVPPRDVAGYGLLAFTSKPLASDIGRDKTVCEAFKAALLSQEELPANTPLSEQMITFWPIKDKNVPVSQRYDCTYMISNYDLKTALDALHDADKQNVGLAQHNGPFLIAWRPSESRYKPDSLVLLFDMSDLSGEQSFLEVFKAWRQKIVDNPELWRNGFDGKGIRLIIRDLLDNYGDELLQLITNARATGTQINENGVGNGPTKLQVTFTLTNNTDDELQAEFTSDQFGDVLLKGGQAWKISKGDSLTKTFSCTARENICYGAWRSNKPDYTWGVGHHESRQSCTDCCLYCGKSHAAWKLVTGNIFHGPTINREAKTVRLPPGIHYNPAHIIGSWGMAHDHHSFIYQHNGHHWHRWYYPWYVAGAWQWFWYDTSADANDSSAYIDDTTDPEAVTNAIATNLPTCDQDTDTCSN